MKRLIPLLIISLFALVVSGCSADNGNAAAGSTITMEALPAAALSSMCDLQMRCGSAGPFAGITFSSKAACVEGLGKLGNLSLAKDQANAKAGKVVYNPENAAKCIALLGSVKCSDFSDDTMQVCEDTFTGNLDNDKVCSENDFCKSGWCKGLHKPQTNCPGVCAAAKKEGEACAGTTDDECAGTLICVNDKCVKKTKAKEGEKCGKIRCDSGLKCIGDGGGEPVCKKLPGSGEPCLSKRYCGAGLRCAAGSCAAPGKAGESCKAGNFQNKAECGAGMQCALKTVAGKQPAGVCMTAKKPGEDCSAVFECIGFDQYCKAGKCTTLPKAGEDCLSEADSPIFRCLMGDSCDKTTKKCVVEVKAKEGGDCSSAECENGLNCQNDKCVKPAAPVCK